MSFLKLDTQPETPPPVTYEALGYLRNPFPQRGEVSREIYVERPELSGLQNALGSFLTDPGAAGGFWALRGDAGLGKSNCLQHINYEIEIASQRNLLRGVSSRYIGNQPISSRNLVEQLLHALGSEHLRQLLGQRAVPPPALRDTDLGRFLAAFHANPELSDVDGAQFLMKWLGGNQTYSEERDRYGLWTREKMNPAVAFPYLRDLLEMLAEHRLLTRVVLLLDEFEEVQRLPEATQRDYVGSLKSLVNVFNWQRLFLVISGQDAVFTTIEQRFTSIKDRWRTATLAPLLEAKDAVQLARSYQNAARDAYLSRHRLSDPPSLQPSEKDVMARFAGLMKKETRGVKHRDLLSALHEDVEALARP